jgi:hypothetical protein
MTKLDQYILAHSPADRPSAAAAPSMADSPSLAGAVPSSSSASSASASAASPAAVELPTLLQLDTALRSLYLFYGHQVRGVNQSMFKDDVLSGMNDHECLVVIDYACKVLGFWFHQMQSEWYGDVATSWFLCFVAFRKDPNCAACKKLYDLPLHDHKTDSQPDEKAGVPPAAAEPSDKKSLAIAFFRLLFCGFLQRLCFAISTCCLALRLRRTIMMRFPV